MWSYRTYSFFVGLSKLFFDKILFSKIEANIPIVCTNNMLECRDDQNSKGNMSLKSAKCLYYWSLCLKYFVLSTGLHQVIYARIWFISGLLWCWSEVVSSDSCLWNLSSIVPVYYCYECAVQCKWIVSSLISIPLNGWGLPYSIHIYSWIFLFHQSTCMLCCIHKVPYLMYLIRILLILFDCQHEPWCGKGNWIYFGKIYRGDSNNKIKVWPSSCKWMMALIWDPIISLGMKERGLCLLSSLS